MRIGVVSDVHCDHVALARALAFFDGDVDEVWCAGDIVLQYRFCERTTQLLRSAKVVAIKGNHDIVLTGVDGAAARRGVDADEIEWLSALPLEHRFEVESCRVLMTHGSPWEPHGDYLRAHNDRWRRADELGVDVVVTGHTHEPMVATFGSTLVVNPGSVGEPRQRDNRCPSVAVIDTQLRSAVVHYLTD